MSTIKGNSQRISHWERRAERVQKAHRPFQEAYQVYRQTRDGYAACEAARENFYAVLGTTYPDEFLDVVNTWRRGEEADYEPILEFLEADPYFYGSGYMKSICLRLLKQVRLTPSNQERARGIILAYISRPIRFQEGREYERLARKVDSPVFREQLVSLLENGAGYEQQRADHILEILGSKWPTEFSETFRRHLLLAIEVSELREDFLHRRKFARRVNTPEFRNEVRRLAREGQDFQRIRAGWVLAQLGERQSPAGIEGDRETNA